MKFQTLTFAFLLFLSVSFAVNFANCHQAILADTQYTMNANVTDNAPGTCFNVTGLANVELDCGGYSLIGDNTTGNSSFGVYSSGANTTIKNCLITNFSEAIQYTIGAANSSIINSTLSSSFLNEYTVYLNGAANVSIANTTANETNIGTGIRILAGGNSTLFNSTGFAPGYGIYIQNSGGNILNRTIGSSYTTNTMGIYVVSGANNTIDCQGRAITGANLSNTYGIYNSAANTTIRGCIVSNSFTAIAFASGANGGSISNTTASSTQGSGYGIDIQSGANNNTISNVTAYSRGSGVKAIIVAGGLTNLTGIIATSNTTGGTTYAIHFTGSGAGSIMNNTTAISDNIGVGVQVNNVQILNSWGQGATNNIGFYILSVANTSFVNTTGKSGSGNGIYVSGTSSGTTINASIGKSASLHAIYSDATGIGLSIDCYGLSLNGTDTVNTYGVYSTQRNTTVKNCVISNFSVGVIFAAGSGNGTIANNTIIGNGSDWGTNKPFPEGINISTQNNMMTNNRMSNLKMGINILAQNNVVDCMNTNMSGIVAVGEPTASGIYSNSSNTTIQNCNIKGFDLSTYLDAGADFSHIYNVTGNCTSGGNAETIYVNGANNVVEQNITAYSQQGIAIYFVSGTNNTLIDAVGTSDNLASAGIQVAGNNATVINATGISAQPSGSTADKAFAVNAWGSYTNISGISESGCGVNVNTANVTISGLTAITNDSCGVLIGSFGGIRISGINITTNGTYGVYFPAGGASNNSFANGTIYSNGFGIYYNQTGKLGAALPDDLNNSFTNLSVVSNNTSYYLLYRGGNNTIDCLGSSIVGGGLGNTYGIHLNASNGVVRNCNISNHDGGIHFEGAPNSSIANSNISSFSGTFSTVEIYGSNNVTVTNTNSTSLAATGFDIQNSNLTTIINSTGTGNNGGYGIGLIGSNNGTYINNTLSDSDIPFSTEVNIDANSGNNTFYWNNFTNTSGSYVNDLNGGNFYNATTQNGTNEGNIWFNVMDNSVNILGINISAYSPNLYIGVSGTGYPYNATTSLGKFVCVSASCADFAPLTFNQVLAAHINATIVYIASGTYGPGQCYLPIWVNVTDDAGVATRILNLTLYQSNGFVNATWTLISNITGNYNLTDLFKTNFTIPISSNNQYRVNGTATVTIVSVSSSNYTQTNSYEFIGTSFCTGGINAVRQTSQMPNPIILLIVGVALFIIYQFRNKGKRVSA